MSLNLVETTEEPGMPMAQVEFREIRKMQISDPIIEKWRTTVTDNKVIEKAFTKHDRFKIKRGRMKRQ